MNQHGTVFDIQRGAMHDGPGIRTTIFLKGCPLNCTWCHNPEARSFERQLFFYFDKCTQCGRCVAACSYDVHQIVDGQHTIDFEKCVLSGDCVAVCPQSALTIMGEETAVSSILAELDQDIDYFNNSGGGMTISGGEPMAQLSFTLELLQACKEKQIHTCIETSGCVQTSRFEKVLPYVDLFLFDYKLTDPELHKTYIGASSKLPLANLDFLYHAGAAIVLRCPIVPGVNDTDDHFQAIQDLNAKYPDLKGIEILPYHDMGMRKAESIGQEIALGDLKTTSPEVAEAWLTKLISLGCHKAKIG